MVAPGEALPTDAFYRDPRALTAQLAFQRALATRADSRSGRRFGEDPTSFAWERVNEARCPSDASGATLARWAKHMSDGLREAGVVQPIAWGGAGYLGQHGEDLRAIAADGGVDLLTLHMYASSLRTAPWRKRADAAIAWGEARLYECSQVARSVGLPLLLEEVNWKPASGPSPQREAERARVLRAWLELAASLDVATLPWMIGERGRIDHDGYL